MYRFGSLRTAHRPDPHLFKIENRANSLPLPIFTQLWDILFKIHF